MPDASAAPDAGVAPDAAPPAVMGFFVTSTGTGTSGGNLGGLAGADARCQMLATAAGAGGRTWRAYLSTSEEDGGPDVNARDRIGDGPWANANGVTIARNLTELHGAEAIFSPEVTLDEWGQMVPGTGGPGPRNWGEHDILTGSSAEGMALPDNCLNWTSASAGRARVGHCDRLGPAINPVANSWNSAHLSNGCSPDLLLVWGSTGRTYCFAVD